MQQHTPKIALILDSIRSTHNVGSVFRTADCFGVTRIYCIGYTPYPMHSDDVRLPHLARKIHQQIHKTALGAEESIPFTVIESIEDGIKQAKRDGYTVAALEQDLKSIPLHRYQCPESLALILGNELDGVSEWTKSQSDVILEIEQYGHKESLNVASAASVALYALRTNRIT